jgi:outer membrane immunogenic protein
VHVAEGEAMRYGPTVVLASLLSFSAAQAALAADIPTKAPKPAAVVAASWSGCYVGGFGGYKTGSVRDTYLYGDRFSNYDFDGGLGGAAIGCNYQSGFVVVGIEGDYAWMAVKGNGFAPNAAFTVESKETWMATARGRLGVAADRALIYLTGGWA